MYSSICGGAGERRQRHSQQTFIACVVVGDHSFSRCALGLWRRARRPPIRRPSKLTGSGPKHGLVGVTASDQALHFSILAVSFYWLAP